MCLGFLKGWGGRESKVQARVCLWKCWFSSRDTTKVVSCYFSCNPRYLQFSFSNLYINLETRTDSYSDFSATLVFEVELVACRPRKGASVSSVSVEKARLE